MSTSFWRGSMVNLLQANVFSDHWNIRLSSSKVNLIVRSSNICGGIAWWWVVALASERSRRIRMKTTSSPLLSPHIGHIIPATQPPHRSQAAATLQPVGIIPTTQSHFWTSKLSKKKKKLKDDKLRFIRKEMYDIVIRKKHKIIILGPQLERYDRQLHQLIYGVLRWSSNVNIARSKRLVRRNAERNPHRDEICMKNWNIYQN